MNNAKFHRLPKQTKAKFHRLSKQTDAIINISEVSRVGEIEGHEFLIQFKNKQTTAVKENNNEDLKKNRANLVREINLQEKTIFIPQVGDVLVSNITKITEIVDGMFVVSYADSCPTSAVEINNLSEEFFAIHTKIINTLLRHPQ